MIRTAPRRRAFTMVELMVVVVIIIILISAVTVASTVLIKKAKSSSTEAMLTVVKQAIDEFKREQTAASTVLVRNKALKNRYGGYPPDEIEAFTETGVARTPKRSIARNAVMYPPPLAGTGYPQMKFYTQGRPFEEARFEHRDQAAMIIAIKTLGDASATILESVQDRYWKTVVSEPGTDEPSLFVDRNGDQKFGPGDIPVRYLVDDWGNHIQYMAQRDFPFDDTSKASEFESPNHDLWNEVSSELILLNGGQPLLFSYGADGAEQLSEEAMGVDGKARASLLGDLEGTDEQGAEHTVDNPFNADNIYADPTFAAKLSAPVEDHHDD